MNNHITFGDYEFSFTIITTENFYEPDEFLIIASGDTLTAQTKRLWYGERSVSIAASVEISFARVLYSPLTQVRANIAAETVVVSEDRARLLEFQLAP